MSDSLQTIWPANHRAALVLFLVVDAVNLETNTSIPSPAGIGLDYTADGLRRLFSLFEDLDIAVTTAWTGRALAAYPVQVRQASEHGHEIALALTSTDSTPVNESKTRAEHLAGSALSGIYGANENLDGTGFLWAALNGGGDVPKVQGQSVSVPTSPWWQDTTWLAPEHPQPPSALIEAWSTGLAAVRSENGLMTLVIHPHVIGRPGFSTALSRILDEAIAAGDVWISRADHLAMWWRDSQNESRS